MTNKERYQKAFAALHASDAFAASMEEKHMERTKKTYTPRLIAVCAAVILVLGLATAAYAADVGGIRRTIQLWVHGDQTDAILEVQDGTYDLYYTDAEGNARERHGGGVAFDVFGNEIPVSEEDILEHLNAPELEYRDDGTVWVYYYGQSVEITDKFDEDGICYVQLKHGGDTLYVTVKYDNGYAYGPHAYPDPRSFNGARG